MSIEEVMYMSDSYLKSLFGTSILQLRPSIISLSVIFLSFHLSNAINASIWDDPWNLEARDFDLRRREPCGQTVRGHKVVQSTVIQILRSYHLKIVIYSRKISST